MTKAELDKPTPAYNEADILTEAKARFKRGMDAADGVRKHFTKNLQFISGDQWTDEAKSARQNKRPMLVINRLRTFASILINEQRQNQLGAKISPRGYGANEDTAEVLAGMVRDIESVSEFEICADVAFKYTIEGNHGWWCIRKEWESEESFDYVLRYEAVEDPLCIVCDPNARKADRSDMRWLFKFHPCPKDEYKPRYGKKAKIVDFSEEHMKSAPDWIKEDTVIVAEYWRVDIKKKTLIEVADLQDVDPDTGKARTRKLFQEDSDEKFAPEQILDEREVECRYVEQFILNGVEVLEHNEWDGQWIPFIPVIGDERWIDGKRVIYSAISHSHDAQRMINYYTTCEAEAAGFAPMPRWVGAVGQFQTNGDDFASPHKNIAKLEYDLKEVGGHPVPPPKWETFTPPTESFLAGKVASVDDVKATMGMSDALTGTKETDQSGKAIEALQRQGNTANFNFFDNLIRSIRHSTRVLIDLIPHVYDTKRQVRILGEDKKEKIITVNAQLMGKDGVPELDKDGKPKGYFLSVGQYGVAIEVGPSNQTQQQQDVQDIQEMMDVVAKSGDPQLLLKVIYLYASAHSGPAWKKLAKELDPNPEQDEKQQVPPEVQKRLEELDQIAQALTEQLNQAKEELARRTQEKQLEIEAKKEIEGQKIQSQERQAQLDHDYELKKLALENTKLELEKAKLDLEWEIAKLKANTDLKKTQASLSAQEHMAERQAEHAHEENERNREVQRETSKEPA